VSDEPVYRRVGDAFVATGHARGPWAGHEVHGGAPAALIARALERVETRVPMRCVRLAFEFERGVPMEPVTVAARVTRPGRRLALAEAVVRHGDAEVMRARATLLRVGEVGGLPAPGVESLPPGPEHAEPVRWRGHRHSEAFYVTGAEVRAVGGASPRAPGPGMRWLRLRRPLVHGEQPTPLQRVAALADFGNGVSRTLDIRGHVFVNTDLTVHLHREPVGEWIGLDARTDLDEAGIGQATSVLHDERGRVGIAAQSLFIDER
jgi:hypothetical protein